MLVNCRNSKSLCISRASKMDSLSIEIDLPLVWLVYTGYYLDESRLSSSVFSHKSMNFSRL
ncbi:MAG: hypothetical protein BWY89_01809 [Bacteroidetes bacterium ADurb.BinA012]|nr:MAG: hypothetical protein BWY89_01809 [Bacteroidetes bacterium ADurb.BinA012]